MKVYICIVLLVFAIQGGRSAKKYYYPNLSTLKNDAMYLCCSHWKSVPWPKLLPRQPVVTGANHYPRSFLATRTGIFYECCLETCDFEEVQEGRGSKSEELGEECIDEGCYFEEMKEHCP